MPRSNAPALTPEARERHDAARAATLAFVRALARQQAWDDHLAETGQTDDEDARRNLRPL
jgi:hypothetical protein